MAQPAEQQDGHGDAGEDGAGHEVGREDRRVPARHHRHREVPRHDAVDRDRERDHDAREDRVGLLEEPPLAVGAREAEREHPVERPAPAASRGDEQRKIGQHAHVEEERAHRHVRADGEHVPDRAASGRSARARAGSGTAGGRR